MGRARILPTLRGWCFLGAGVLFVVAAYVFSHGELLVAGAAPILVVLANLLALRLRRPRFEAERRLESEFATAGEPSVVQLRVRNIGAAPSPAVHVADQTPWDEGELRPLPSLGPDFFRDLEYVIRPTRRGRVKVGPLLVQQEDGFGLMRQRLVVGGTDSVVVTPAVTRLPAGGVRPAEGTGSVVILRRSNAGRDDDLSTREYRPGDALRRVHWRASARHGELRVRQEEAHSTPQALLVVDTRVEGYPDLHGGVSPAFEWAVRMTASLAMHLDDAGYRVDIHETAEPQLAALTTLGDAWHRASALLTSLAEVRLLPASRRGSERQRDESGSVDDHAPAFALVSSPEPELLAWLARQRGARDRAVAFLVSSPQPEADAESLAAIGWETVPVDPTTPVDAAWRQSAPDAPWEEAPVWTGATLP